MGIKLELLGIGVSLAGIALSMNSIFAYLGALGLALVFGGFFWKDRS